MMRTWLLWVAVTAAAVTVVTATVGAALPGSCPHVCFCPLDARGRLQVLCTTGGLMDPLPVLEMPENMEVLEVGAPQDRLNTLTLGPIFKSHTDLEHLSVTRSRVPALGAHSFWGLRRLYTLNVSHNALTAVMDSNFRGAESLQTLDLSHNQIESVPSAVFRHVSRLRHLNLAHNRIPELVARVFYGLKNLRTVDLSYNPLGILPYDRFNDISSLRELRCAACGLQQLSEEVFKVLPELNLLDIRRNRLIVVPGLAAALQLSILHLDSNHVTSLAPGGLAGPPLTTLTLSHNRLASLEPQAFANSSLTHLDLAYNRLTRLRSDAINDGFSRLRYLRLSGNPFRLENLVQVVPRTRQMRYLELASLGLSTLDPDLLRHARHLKTLNVSSNLLSKFPASALFATPHLTVLDLSYNDFRGLPQDLVTAFITMGSLERVWLQGNPWRCEQCHLGPMLAWLQDAAASRHPHAEAVCHNHPKSQRCLRCAGPPQLVDREVQLLDPAHLPPCSEQGTKWPEWRENSPRPTRDQQATLSEEPVQVLDLFGDHLALIVGVGVGLVLALLLVLAAALLLARRHSALYYTNEPADQDSSQKLMSRNNNDNSPPGPRAATPRSPRRSSPPAIATIEEVDSIAGSSMDLQPGRELRAPRIVRLVASPLP
ncbi:platelet glycoprotein V-like [Scylla paramamosain]|uniref:platelet glycoprotein V-like n=1 Tax=Scylla paramamosain TaxID=85552 RepID=UPI003082F53F